MSKFNVNQNNPLIDREQTYVLDRKLLTIHSEDRDYAKWPNANHFEIQLPQDYLNVESIRLVESTFPVNYDTFTNDYQNTKFTFKMLPNIRPSTDETNNFIYTTLNNVEVSITIQNGFYNPLQMANEIKGKMNDAVTDILYENFTSPLTDEAIELLNYQHFQCNFDIVGKHLYIGNDYDNFVLQFQKYIPYTLNCKQSPQQPTMWDKYTKWGLPYYLGFEKKKYDTFSTSEGVVFNYDNTIWCSPSALSKAANIQDETGIAGVSYYVKAPFPINLFGETVIYMKIDKLNSMDSLTPYVNSFHTVDKIKQNGEVNSSFAKIPLTDTPLSQVFDSRNGFLQNISHYFPPLERIFKLKFTFCFHDGRLVDFGNNNFNFTISLNMLKDEISRKYTVRIPSEYTL